MRDSVWRKLVDSRTGIITEVSRMPQEPSCPEAYVSYGARVAAVARCTTGIADRYAFGAALGDEASAKWAAVGESVERYCGNAVPTNLKVASYSDLTNRGESALNPGRLALYSPEQYRADGFPFIPFLRSLEVPWVTGTELCNQTKVLVPASLVYLNPYRVLKSAPRTNFMIYAGIAAGSSTVSAQRSAIEEVIERDAVTMWWHGGGNANALSLESCPETLAYVAGLIANDIDIQLIEIPAVIDASVVGALIRDRRHQIVAFGSACRADLRSAARKAVTEALQVSTLVRELQIPTSDLWRTLAAPGARTAGKYSADRSYRDQYREDLRDVTDLIAHSQLWLDPKVQDQYLGRFDCLLPERADRPPPGKEKDGDTILKSHVSELAEIGLQVICVDLTTPDVCGAGLKVCRVVIPGLCSNAPAAFLPLGGPRLGKSQQILEGCPRGMGVTTMPLPFS